jgi:hypothetical protein
MYPPQPQPKKSNRGLIIGCSIAAAVLLLICGGVGVALYIGAHKAGDALQSAGTAAAATTAATEFCTDVISQQYDAAYQLLSTAEQGRVGTESQFATRAAALDTSDGTVDTCEPDSSQILATVSSDGKSATAKFNVGRSNATSPGIGNITLVYEDNTWKIDGVDAALKLI